MPDPKLTLEEAADLLYSQPEPEPEPFERGDRFVTGTRFALIQGKTVFGSYQVARLDLAKTRTGDCRHVTMTADELTAWLGLDKPSTPTQPDAETEALRRENAELKAQIKRLETINQMQSNQIRQTLKRLAEQPTTTRKRIVIPVQMPDDDTATRSAAA